jgi:ketosteroid isomerase-like protein
MRLLLLLAVTACAHVDPEAMRRSLLKADSDFAADVAARGTDGWADAFAEDGEMFISNQPVVRGREKIRALMSDLGDPRKAPPALQIKWKPLGADVSADGTLGWTYGNAVSISARGENKLKYVTVWRKQADGSWKVAVDQGTLGWADPDVAP